MNEIFVQLRLFALAALPDHLFILCDGSARVTDVAGAAGGPLQGRRNVPILIGPQGDGLPGM